MELCATAESNSNSSVVKSMHMIKFFLAAAAGRHVADVVHVGIILTNRVLSRTRHDYSRPDAIMPISLEVRLDLCATAESN